MAMCDYYLCDVCGEKCFYDVDLNYDRVGQMKAICDTCVKTNLILIVPRPSLFDDDAQTQKWAYEFADAMVQARASRKKTP